MILRKKFILLTSARRGCELKRTVEVWTPTTEAAAIDIAQIDNLRNTDQFQPSIYKNIGHNWYLIGFNGIRPINQWDEGTPLLIVPENVFVTFSLVRRTEAADDRSLVFTSRVIYAWMCWCCSQCLQVFFSSLFHFAEFEVKYQLSMYDM